MFGLKIPGLNITQSSKLFRSMIIGAPPKISMWWPSAAIDWEKVDLVESVESFCSSSTCPSEWYEDFQKSLSIEVIKT